jgi:hypothetical protein
VVVVLVVFVVAGVVVGVIWPHLVDPVTVTRDKLGVTTGELALSERFDNDGWYVLLALALGLVLGVALTAWRRSNEVVTVLAVVASALVAAWVSATVGTRLGPEDPNRVLAQAENGASAPDVVRVSADGAYAMWPIGAMAGALIVLWGPPGGLRRREEAGSPPAGPEGRTER